MREVVTFSYDKTTICDDTSRNGLVQFPGKEPVDIWAGRIEPRIKRTVILKGKTEE